MEKRIKLWFWFYSVYEVSFNIDTHNSIFKKAKQKTTKQENRMQYCKVSDIVLGCIKLENQQSNWYQSSWEKSANLLALQLFYRVMISWNPRRSEHHSVYPNIPKQKGITWTLGPDNNGNSFGGFLVTF